jgi:hypothetical protein
LLLSNNRVVKISENVTSVARISNDDQPNASSDLAAKVTAKLSKLEEAVVGRVGECERAIGRLCNRSEIMDEQVAIVGRKLEKERTRIAEVVAGFKRI